jgi:hypothetical protein
MGSGPQVSEKGFAAEAAGGCFQEGGEAMPEVCGGVLQTAEVHLDFEDGAAGPDIGSA